MGFALIVITKDDNSKKKLIEVIQKELEFINSSLNMQKNLSTQVLKYFKELATDIDVNKDTKNMEIYFLKSNQINEMLKKSNDNINEYEELYKEINEFSNNANSLKINELVQQINEYNAIYRNSADKILTNTTEIEAFLMDSTPEVQDFMHINENVDTIEETLNNISQGEKNDLKSRPKEKIVSLSELELDLDSDFVRSRELAENTLTISEQDKVVVLPYTYKKIHNILKANPDKYTDLYDVIDKVYTKPIKYYRNAPVARFREAYKLAKDKENMSFKGALDLAFECFFNSVLHPAIISSCDNLNQLDVYLSCLEYDELEDFYFFDIIYKIPPLKQNKNDMFSF